ncbi:MAG: SMI1/KNR4 family protein [Armatimonadota bacterium]
MESVVQRLHRYWLEHRVRMLPGASQEELDAFERANGVRLPPDIREFLQTMNGFEQYEWDPECVEWYPISRWERLSEYGHYPFEDADQYFVCADWMLHAFIYAVRLDASGKCENTFLLLGPPGPPEVLARSFSELFEAYLKEGPVMLGGSPRGAT